MYLWRNLWSNLWKNSQTNLQRFPLEVSKGIHREIPIKTPKKIVADIPAGNLAAVSLEKSQLKSHEKFLEKYQDKFHLEGFLGNTSGGIPRAVPRADSRRIPEGITIGDTPLGIVRGISGLNSEGIGEVTPVGSYSRMLWGTSGEIPASNLCRISGRISKGILARTVWRFRTRIPGETSAWIIKEIPAGIPWRPLKIVKCLKWLDWVRANWSELS